MRRNRIRIRRRSSKGARDRAKKKYYIEETSKSHRNKYFKFLLLFKNDDEKSEVK